MSLQSTKRGAAGIWIALRNTAISAGVPFPLLSYSVKIQQIACSSSGRIVRSVRCRNPASYYNGTDFGNTPRASGKPYLRMLEGIYAAVQIEQKKMKSAESLEGVIGALFDLIRYTSWRWRQGATEHRLNSFQQYYRTNDA